MVNKNKYGSFTVKIKGEDTVINPLTQKDIAEGWRLVLPKVTSTRVVLSYGSRQIIKNKKNYKIFRINLSQLPEHLWDKLTPKYEDCQYSHSVAKDNMYLYIVKDTPVDKEIRELYNYIFYQSYNKKMLNYMKNIITLLEDNNISGWVLLKAKMILNQYS
jgi:hypothetical protein